MVNFGTTWGVLDWKLITICQLRANFANIYSKTCQHPFVTLPCQLVFVSYQRIPDSDTDSNTDSDSDSDSCWPSNGNLTEYKSGNRNIKISAFDGNLLVICCTAFPSKIIDNNNSNKRHCKNRTNLNSIAKYAKKSPLIVGSPFIVTRIGWVLLWS